MITRQINDWELGEVEELLKRLQGQVIRRGVEDVMAWRLTKGGTFIVNSFNSALLGLFLKGFPVGIVWNPLVSMRANFFAWEVVWKKF